MPDNIKCPSCGYEFEPSDVIRNEIEKELRSKMADWKKDKEKQYAEDTAKLQRQLEQEIRKSVSTDFEVKLRQLEQNDKDKEEKLKIARQKEAEYLRMEQDLKNKEAEIELQIQRQLQKEREKLSDEIRKIEEQKVAQKETE
ncbi:MAG: DUF2130 domain-containing protein, partial [Chitinophagaceae bacterium]|nr:DUF2130 domain-containing protein [Chitinophagaceae bacterium]